MPLIFAAWRLSSRKPRAFPGASGRSRTGRSRNWCRPSRRAPQLRPWRIACRDGLTDLVGSDLEAGADDGAAILDGGSRTPSQQAQPFRIRRCGESPSCSTAQERGTATGLAREEDDGSGQAARHGTPQNGSCLSRDPHSSAGCDHRLPVSPSHLRAKPADRTQSAHPPPRRASRLRRRNRPVVIPATSAARRLTAKPYHAAANGASET